MTKPCILCVAITGSLPTKANNPAVPITIAEQIESTQAAFEAGASIAHCHVRDDEGKPTSDPDRFARLVEGLKTHCPGMIIQLSTGGRSGAGAARGGMLPLRPDMASLSVGSNNFPTRVYENPPDLVDWLASEMLKYNVKPEIECFDLSHIVQAASMARDGRLVIIAFLGGFKTEADLRPIMVKRLTVTGSTMRPRTTAEKGEIAAALAAKVWPLLEAGKAGPRIFQTFPLTEAVAAHRLMESSAHIGKIMLKVAN